MSIKERKKPGAVKPKYNMWQNTAFMVALAWSCKEKKVLVTGALSAGLVVLLNLVNLTISPAIFGAVERRASIGELLLTIGGFVMALALVSAASAYVDSNTMFGRISVRTELIRRINRKACATSYCNLDDDRFQKLLNKSAECTGNNDEATEAVWTTLTNLAANAAGFALYVALLATVQPLLMVVILGAAAASYAISSRLNGYGYRHREEEAQAERQAVYLADRASDRAAAKDIRIFGLRPWLEGLFQKSMAAYDAFQKRAQGVYAWAKVADVALTFLRNGVAYAYLIALVVRGGLGVAEFLLYFSAVEGFSQWVTGILENLNTLHRQSLDLTTVRECLEYPEPFQLEGGEPLRPQPGASYELRLEGVSFRYPGAQKDVLSGVSLTLRPGEKLAVVGLNGAGKTTLVKLMCGFLDPTEGRVLLNGRDIRDFNRVDYYAMFSAVFQSFSLLAGSVAANVAQSEEAIDLPRVQDCLERAGLGEKVASLSQGCDTLLNREVYEEAVLLSGGETQRLMLARALYKDAPFIVLDEPTAALDPIAESDMYQKYNAMTRGRSSVYISHRLASTRFCDRIVLLEGGDVREEGTHEELLRLGGRYAQLFEVQSKYYRKEAGGNEQE